MKMTGWIVLGLFLALILVIAWASFPWSLNEHKFAADIVNVEPEDMMEADEHPSVIKILTFNLGFLHGRGSEGPGYEHREADFYQKALDKLVVQIKEWNPDVICFQEVDFESSRSGDINQAQYIAKKAGYPYVAEAHSWTANYIPFPYWPLKNNYGRVSSGGAILSKFPLSNHEVTLLPKPEPHPWWYNLFYLHRYFQKVTVSLGEKKFHLINLHLEAFDIKTREKEVSKLVALVKADHIDFIAGDFNMLPKSATKRSKFYNTDNYEGDKSYSHMLKSNLSEVIPDDIYAKEENLYFTFPAWAPDRRLDYIWFKPDLKLMKAEVLSSDVSDHLPLRASFQIDGPRFNPFSL